MSTSPAHVQSTTLPFEKFWAWLHAHANCILRAGTPESSLFDHEDYHWHLAAEDDATLVVQLVRGKELVGELVVMPADVAYVTAVESDGDEVAFELVIEHESGREVAYHFIMAHGYDDESSPPTSRHMTH